MGGGESHFQREGTEAAVTCFLPLAGVPLFSARSLARYLEQHPMTLQGHSVRGWGSDADGRSWGNCRPQGVVGSGVSQSPLEGVPTQGFLKHCAGLTMPICQAAYI